LTLKSQNSEYSEAEVRDVLAARLELRRGEIEEAVLRRIAAIADAGNSEDPEYQVGLRLAVSVAVAFGITAIREGPEELPPVPTELLSQARTAAKHRIQIDTVLQRYIAGRSIFDRILLDEAANDRRFSRTAVTTLAASAAAALALVARAVSQEHSAAKAKTGTPAQTHAAQLTRLLNEEPVRATDLEYDFSATHIGVIGEGSDVMNGLRRLATAVDGRLLTGHPEGSEIWAWIGMRQPLPRDELVRATRVCWPSGSLIGLGELGKGVAGWRRTHFQARVAFAQVGQLAARPTHYADVAVIHSIIQDDLLCSSLFHLYLAPLEAERDKGITLRETLRAYFAASRSIVSAASSLGVSRQTVASRLRQIEGLIGCSIPGCATELELALLAAGD
jgi:PucR C-terminal helix-turn-helix domain